MRQVQMRKIVSVLQQSGLWTTQTFMPVSMHANKPFAGSSETNPAGSHAFSCVDTLATHRSPKKANDVPGSQATHCPVGQTSQACPAGSR